MVTDRVRACVYLRDMIWNRENYTHDARMCKHTQARARERGCKFAPSMFRTAQSNGLACPHERACCRDSGLDVSLADAGRTVYSASVFIAAAVAAKFCTRKR